MAFEQDFGHLRVEIGARLARGGDDHFDVGQAFDLAADGTHEVGVFAMFVAIAAAELETPDVIAEIMPQHEPRFGHFHQAAVDGRFIEAFGNQHVGHVGMTLGTVGTRQMLKDGYAAGRTT